MSRNAISLSLKNTSEKVDGIIVAHHLDRLLPRHSEISFKFQIGTWNLDSGLSLLIGMKDEELLFIRHHPGHQAVFLSQCNTAKVEEEVEDLVFDNEVCEADIRVPVQRGLQRVEVIRLPPARIHHGDTLYQYSR